MITHKTKNNRFYIKIEYPSNTIKLKLPYDDDYVIHVYEYTKTFIEKLNTNDYWSQLWLARHFHIHCCLIFP